MGHEDELLLNIQKQSKRYFVISIIISLLIGSFLFIRKANKKMDIDAIVNHLRERVQEEIDKSTE